MSAAPPSLPAISVRGLRVSYGAREVLHGLAFDIMRG